MNKRNINDFVKNLKQDIRSIAQQRAAKIDILFYSGHTIHTQWILSTLEVCVARGFRCALVYDRLSTPRIESKASYPTYTISRYFLPLLKAKIIVTATSGLRLLYLWPYKYRVYMPHSLTSLHMSYPPKAFDAYNVFFASGPHHVAEIRMLDSFRPKSQRRIFSTCYGKMDVLKQVKPVFYFQGEERKRKTVLIAPSWGKQNIINILGEELTEILLQSGFNVILRPHPSMWIYQQQTLRRIQDRFAYTGRFYMEDSTTKRYDSYFTSDLMISDYSGAAYEFAFLRERPVLFVDLPEKALNPHWSKMPIVPMEIELRNRIGRLVQPNASLILAGVNALLKDLHLWSERIRQIRSQYIYAFDKHCGTIAATYLTQLLKE